jgi:hypothetical protein
MTLPTWNHSASTNGYEFRPLSTATIQDVGGGLPIVREDAIDALGRVKVTWKLTADGYEEFLTFFNDTLEEGTLPFLTNLVFDYRDPRQYQALFVPGSVVIDEAEITGYTISAELEVVPAADPDSDDLLLELVDTTYGSVEAVDDLFFDLSHLVNVVMPDTLGG